MVEARRPKTPPDRLKLILGIQIGVIAIIIIRLFFLQVVFNNFYKNVAAKEHNGYTELPARRGEILIRDRNSPDLFRLATNTTLDLLYADPTLIKDPDHVVDTLMPLVFSLDEARENDNTRIEEERKKLEPVLTEIEQQQKELEKAKLEEEKAKAKQEKEAQQAQAGQTQPTPTSPKTAPTQAPTPSTQPAATPLTLNEIQQKLLLPLSDEELKQKFHDTLFSKLTSKTRTQIILGTDIEDDIVTAIKEKNLSGVTAENGVVSIYPIEMENKTFVVRALASLLKITEAQIQKIMNAKNRYEVIKRKLPPDISIKIKTAIKDDKDNRLDGIGLQPEYYRYYPEHTLAANIIGYVSGSGQGYYGIENKFNIQLQGKKGVFQAQKDSIGRQITVGDSVIQPAVDGDNIVLTIDRSIQMKLDRIIQRGVNENHADDGLGVVYDPQNGRILAISHAPSFDPNVYGKVFDKEQVHLKPEEIARLTPIDEKTGRYRLLVDIVAGIYEDIFKETYKDGTVIYKKYKNTIGSGAFQNKAVAWPYEPGSVFKPFVMSAAIDDNDVTPTTQYNDSGPIKTDEYLIKNALEKYYGTITMTTVLEKSLNTGMAFIARKIGRNLLYNYIKNYGFGERTDVEFSDEAPGKIAHFTQWAESELITHAFGQGLTVTPIQMVTAYGALANKGSLMQPYIIDEIQQTQGKSIKNNPHIIRQVISEKTSKEVTQMLISAVERGVATHAQVPHHYVAAKTGTAQTYFRGKPLSGTGTTLATVIGFGPVDKPQFVLLIKLTRPRKSEWADATAAPMFAEMAQFLFDYLGIPPDKQAITKPQEVGVE